LTEGLNPYATPFSDAYANSRETHDYGYSLLGYAYFPLGLLVETTFWKLCGDARAAHIFAELVAAVAIFAAGGGGPRARWAILLFLFMPRGLLVIEKAWTEPLLVAAFACANWAAVRHPGSRRLAVAYGLMLGLKQYLVFFILHGLMIERKPARLALAVAVTIAPFIPFAIWDGPALFQSSIMVHLHTPFRADALTLSAALYARTGIELAKWVALLIGLASSSLCFFALRRFGAAGWRLSAILTTFSVFLFSSQGFANYYYFIAAMMTVHLACAAREETPH
jgi:hypothetical protein